MISTCNDNHSCIGKLLLKGAQNLLECLKVAETQNKPQALAVLLLTQAAISGNSSIVKRLFRESESKAEKAESVYEKVFANAQHALLSGAVSTIVPIEIAQRNGHVQVHRELLLRTHMDSDKQSIQWNGLKLDRLDYFLLWRMVWVKTLELARNTLKKLPIDIGDYLKQVSSHIMCGITTTTHNSFSFIEPYCRFLQNEFCQRELFLKITLKFMLLCQLMKFIFIMCNYFVLGLIQIHYVLQWNL